MVSAGDVMENPVSGQRLIFRKTARDTAGDLLEVESVYTKPTPHRPPAHFHPLQDERFEVISGRLGVLLNGEERTLGEGKVLIVPSGTPHEMWADEAGTRVHWQTSPALNTEAFFETLWGLAKDGKTNEKGVPDLLRVALIALEYEDEFRLATPPWVVQRALFGVLALVGRALGYEAQYPYSADGPQAASGTSVERWSVGPRTLRGKLLVAAVLGLFVLLVSRRNRRPKR